MLSVPGIVRLGGKRIALSNRGGIMKGIAETVGLRVVREHPEEYGTIHRYRSETEQQVWGRGVTTERNPGSSEEYEKDVLAVHGRRHCSNFNSGGQFVEVWRLSLFRRSPDFCSLAKQIEQGESARRNLSSCNVVIKEHGSRTGSEWESHLVFPFNRFTRSGEMEWNEVL